MAHGDNIDALALLYGSAAALAAGDMTGARFLCDHADDLDAAQVAVAVLSAVSGRLCAAEAIPTAAELGVTPGTVLDVLWVGALAAIRNDVGGCHRCSCRLATTDPTVIVAAGAHLLVTVTAASEGDRTPAVLQQLCMALASLP
jgi:hypothetical protein